MADVSVVIPAYNAERTLARAIDSVLSQEGVYTEVIVCNDGSTDGTARLLADYRDRIMVIEQENRGRGAARNACLERAAAPFIALLDADDWWAPGKLRTQLAAAAERPDTDVFYSDAWMVDRGGVIHRKLNGEWHVAHSGWVFPYLVRQNFVPMTTMLVRRCAMEHVGPFDESLPRCQDLDWTLRLSVHSRFHYDPTPLAFYDDQNCCTDEKLLLTYENYLRLLDKMEMAEPALASQYRCYFNKSVSDCHYAIGSHWAGKGMFAEAADRFALALARTPGARVVLWQYALALYNAGRVEQAIEAFSRYLDGDPYHVEAHFYLGNLWLLRGEFNRARTALEQSLYGGYLYQKFPECVNNLGVVFARLGDMERARELWSQALEQRAMYSDAIRNLQLSAACASQARWTKRRVF